MRFCRETHQYTSDMVAAHLHISTSEYNEIETGKRLLFEKQAHRLGQLFNVNGEYIYQAALQLDLLLSKSEIIKFHKEKIEELKQQLQELQNPISSNEKK